MTGDQLGQQSDQETEHGHTAIQEFGAIHALTLNLGFGCLLVPVVAGLADGVEHDVTKVREVMLQELAKKVIGSFNSKPQVRGFTVP